MNAISKWFANGALYKEGVSLYEALPANNKVLLANFKRKESLQLHDKLKYVLQQYIAQAEKVIVQKKAKEVAPVVSAVQHIANVSLHQEKKAALYFHELPEELRPVLLQANNLFKEMCLLKVKLNELPAHAEIEALAIQIDISKKQKENQNCWTKIEYWRKHKVAPKQERSEFEDYSPALLLRKEQYHFAAISKLEKRLQQNIIDLENTISLDEKNKINRLIARQESNLITKRDELITIKALINGKG